MARRKRRHGRAGAVAALTLILTGAVAIWLGLHTLIGPGPTGFLMGFLAGAGSVLAVARPRLSLRVSTRGTRARPLGGRAR
jgi:hypothetical protein